MKYTKTPYWLAFKFYGPRLFVVSAIWFIYDVGILFQTPSTWSDREQQFSTYSFGIYSSSILANIYGDDAPLTQVFGWNTVINLFYVPGAMLGGYYSDWYVPLLRCLR